MDDERFYELIRRLMYLKVRHVYSDSRLDRKTRRKEKRQALIDQIEREIAAREIAAAVNRENERLAVKGP